MKWLKYSLSALLLVGLTALTLLFPRLYYGRADRKESSVDVRTLRLESTRESFTAAETLRILSQNASNGIYSEQTSSLVTSAVMADCKEIVEMIFGSPLNSLATKYFVQTMQTCENATVQAYQFLTLAEGDVVRFTLISAQFGDLYLCYDRDTKAVIEIDCYVPFDEIAAEEAQKLIAQLESGVDIGAYYSAFGLQSWESGSLLEVQETGFQFSAGIGKIREIDGHF